MARYGMAIDLSKCVGCRTCMVACKTENGTPASHFFMYVFRFSEGTYPDAMTRYLPRPCNHCENPPCVPACPKKARIQWKDGLVLTDVDLCEGIRACEATCPYGANYFNVDDPKANQYLDWDDANATLEGMWPDWSPELTEEYTNSADAEKKDRRVAGAGYRKDTVGKCTFCVHRLEAGNTDTACEQACPAHAIIFGDLDDATSDVSKAIAAAGSKVFQLKTSAGTKPKVYYLGKAPDASAVPVEMVPLKKGVQLLGQAPLKNGTIPWK